MRHSGRYRVGKSRRRGLGHLASSSASTLDLNNVAPVELDLTKGQLKLSNGRPVRDADEVTWTQGGRKLWQLQHPA